MDDRSTDRSTDLRTDRRTKRSRRGFLRQLATLAAGGTTALLVPAVANAATSTAVAAPAADAAGGGTAGAGTKSGTAAVAGGGVSAVERAAVAAGCAVYCRPVVCDWTPECPGWSITLRCTNYCDGSSFILCKSFASPCAGFCYSRNVC
jgi:hypothetical protein